MHRLFHEFAHRYDLHTPPGHYQHDHAFVIGEALRIAAVDCRLLDIGCGTGVFLEAAVAAGIDGRGIDAAPEMVEVARRRLGSERVCVRRMQEMVDEGIFDVICSLSWAIHYCETKMELETVARGCHRALRAGGLLVLQVANAEKMTGSVEVDREPGPSGEPDDTFLLHRFCPLGDPEKRFAADYVYASRSYKEVLSERHELRFASPAMIVDALRRAEFRDIAVLDPESISPFVIGNRT